MQNPKVVSGTDSDLRRLTKSQIIEICIETGFPERELTGLSKWKMLALIKDHPEAQKAAAANTNVDLSKYARGERLTVK